VLGSGKSRAGPGGDRLSALPPAARLPLGSITGPSAHARGAPARAGRDLAGERPRLSALPPAARPLLGSLTSRWSERPHVWGSGSSLALHGKAARGRLSAVPFAAQHLLGSVTVLVHRGSAPTGVGLRIGPGMARQGSCSVPSPESADWHQHSSTIRPGHPRA